MPRSLKLLMMFCLLWTGLVTKAQDDSTVHFQRDSVIDIEMDCTTSFFQRSERVPTTGKTMIVSPAGKTSTLTAFFSLNKMGRFSEHGITDLDGDGKKELVVYNYTNGAHCCDEIYVFKNAGPNKYQEVAKLFMGNTCITEANEFLYDFYELFGYFYTCYACAFEDTADTAPIELRHITLTYNRGKMVIKQIDKELRSKLNDNLAKLGEQPYENLSDNMAQDNGLRKEFAMNLAVYYFSFGRNLIETQKLFNKYYKFPDAKKVWIAFTKQIQFWKKTNMF